MHKYYKQYITLIALFPIGALFVKEENKLFPIVHCFGYNPFDNSIFFPVLLFIGFIVWMIDSKRIDRKNSNTRNYKLLIRIFLLSICVVSLISIKNIVFVHHKGLTFFFPIYVPMNESFCTKKIYFNDVKGDKQKLLLLINPNGYSEVKLDDLETIQAYIDFFHHAKQDWSIQYYLSFIILYSLVTFLFIIYIMIINDIKILIGKKLVNFSSSNEEQSHFNT
jgi:hypothetical protein